MFLKDRSGYCEENTFQEGRSQKYQVGDHCNRPPLQSCTIDCGWFSLGVAVSRMERRGQIENTFWRQNFQDVLLMDRI